MPKRATFTLEVGVNPNPEYPSLDAAIRANVPLIRELIDGGHAIRMRREREQRFAQEEAAKSGK